MLSSLLSSLIAVERDIYCVHTPSAAIKKQPGLPISSLELNAVASLFFRTTNNVMMYQKERDDRRAPAICFIYRGVNVHANAFQCIFICTFYSNSMSLSAASGQFGERWSDAKNSGRQY